MKTHQSKPKFSLFPHFIVFCDFVTYKLKLSCFSCITGEYNFSLLVTSVHSPIGTAMWVCRLTSLPWFRYSEHCSNIPRLKKKKAYTQQLQIPRNLKLLTVKGHWNCSNRVYLQISYWNSILSTLWHLWLVILSNTCFHLKQNGPNQVMVGQT